MLSTDTMTLVSVSLQYGIGSINMISIHIVSINMISIHIVSINMISNNTLYIIFPIRIYQRFCRVLGFSLQWLTTGREFSPLTCWPRPLGSKPHDFHQPCGNYPGLSDLVDQRPGWYSLHWLSRRSYWRLGICWPTRSSWAVERWRRIFSGIERRIWSIFHYI